MLNVIKTTLLEFVEIGEDKINEDTYFIRDLNLTSYDIMCFIGKIEDVLGVEVEDSEIKNLETVKDLDEYLKNKMK
ncbi:acyl carrier protein [Alkalibaculum bacchi]|uniref:Acyl carrier protein n=1 Tax=Alkalibaculum bacchi TaxID=645887 RepID=A0A366IBZ6_9FIRM|nr:acyl carrier protein [Alkalibaculum bacchi]RBP66012.1 acyl carrier protein [Alkalibaculum bacchi]